jgi:predicted metal-dependent peptidase
MTPSNAFDTALRGANARLRANVPFFATLALFAPIQPGKAHATDGYRVTLNATDFLERPRPERDAILLHLLLHTALQHARRRGARDEQRWSAACDVVVNGIIASYDAFTVPSGWIREPELEHLSVEEVYACLESCPSPPPEWRADLRERSRRSPKPREDDSSPTPDASPLREPPKDANASSGDEPDEHHGDDDSSREDAGNEGSSNDGTDTEDSSNESPGDDDAPGNGEHSPESSEGDGQPEGDSSSSYSSEGSDEGDADSDGDQDDGEPADTELEDAAPPDGEPDDLEAYWQAALGYAAMIQESTTRGTLPGGLQREYDLVRNAQISWRDALARLVCRRPVDFDGWDRRFFSRGLYLESLEGVSVTVDICIDTSGSVNHEALNAMLSEVAGILESYPGMTASISYADARLHGPYPFESWETLEPPVGGGGTDFRPFFTHLESLEDVGFGERVAIYLTDGYGAFPKEPPSLEVIWVVTPGGASDEAFPFGEVIRLIDLN